MHDNGVATADRLHIPVDMREGVPDGLLASRELRIFDGIEVAHTRYLPGEMRVPPIRGYLVNLHLGGTGKLTTRLNGATCERRQIPGSVEVFYGDTTQERALMGTVSEDVNVSVAEELVKRVAAQAGADPDSIEMLDTLDARDPQVERILLSLLSETETQNLGGELYAQSLAAQLAVHLLREHTSLGKQAGRRGAHDPTGDLNRRALKKAADYVGDNLTRSLSLAEIAGAANLSERQLHRLFKEFTDLSPHQYVIRERVWKARELLANTDLPAGEVALAAGFSHQSHLARHLVRLVGLTPARFRAQARR